MEIRKTTGADVNDIRQVVIQAFDPKQGPEVVDLVDGLLADTSAMPLLSLIAVESSRALGYVLFTKSRIIGSEFPVSSVILAPLAVIPEVQSQGIGGQLIEVGLKRLAESGVELVFVLGHPDYYPRHGFTPADVLGFEAPYPIPEKDADAWMVQELKSGLIGKVKGKVGCSMAMDRPEHWRE